MRDLAARGVRHVERHFTAENIIDRPLRRHSRERPLQLLGWWGRGLRDRLCLWVFLLLLFLLLLLPLMLLLGGGGADGNLAPDL